MSSRRLAWAIGVLVMGSSAAGTDAVVSQECADKVRDVARTSEALLQIATGNQPRQSDASSVPQGAITADDVLRSPKRRVRVLPRRLRDLPSAGFRRSTTFGRLLVALQGRDVIVHVHESPYPLEVRGAQLVMGKRVGHFRFVRVQIGNRPVGDDLIALLGHELFHALEIAHSPEVMSHAGLGQLFRRIGFRTAQDGHFDSDGARAVERWIRLELSGVCR